MVENVIQIKSVIKINVDVSVKNIIYVKKNYIWNPAKCSCENGKYLANIVDDDSVIRCDEIIDADAEPKSYDKAKSFGEETKAISTNFNGKKQPVKHKISIFYLQFLLIVIALLTAVSIYG